MQEFIKFVNLITPGTEVLVLWHCRISHIVKMKYFLSSSLLMGMEQTSIYQ